VKTPTLKVTRLVLAVTLVVVAGVLVVAAFQLEGGGRGSELMMGLATEVFGIIVTLAVVDWMLERRRRQERARDLAWATLHSLERAVWVWQGGPRRVSTDELLGIVQGIGTADDLQPLARSLLATVGTRSLEILDREATSVDTVPGLASALQELSSLHSLANERASVSIALIIEVLQYGIQRLARVLGLPSQAMPSALIGERNAAADAQDERYERIRSGLSEAEWAADRLNTN
jgi:hypothetical protein